MNPVRTTSCLAEYCATALGQMNLVQKDGLLNFSFTSLQLIHKHKNRNCKYKKTVTLICINKLIYINKISP